MTKRISILEQERREAVKDYIAQLSQVMNDEVDNAYQRGLYEGHKKGHIFEGRWFLFGIVLGIFIGISFGGVFRSLGL